MQQRRRQCEQLDWNYKRTEEPHALVNQVCFTIYHFSPPNWIVYLHCSGLKSLLFFLPLVSLYCPTLQFRCVQTFSRHWLAVSPIIYYLLLILIMATGFWNVIDDWHFGRTRLWCLKVAFWCCSAMSMSNECIHFFNYLKFFFTVGEIILN